MRRQLRKRGRYADLPAVTRVAKRQRTSSFRHVVERVEEGQALSVGELRATSRYDSRRLGPMLRLGIYTFAAVLAAALWVFRGELWVVGDSPPLSAAAPSTSSTAPSSPVVTVVIDAADVVETVQAALVEAGFLSVIAEQQDDVILLMGVIPASSLEEGVFGFIEQVKTIAEFSAGELRVESRLALRGDAGVLRANLLALTERQPVSFEGGSATLGGRDEEVLEQVAASIRAHPGLSVLIAGHTDSAGSVTENEDMARRRGLAVFEFLVSHGVAPNRLTVVAYGEMFPDGDAEPSRRIEFEVGL